MKTFAKSFTQQEPVPEEAIDRVVDLMRSGRLHRYNVDAGEDSEAALLEREYAAWQGAAYCLACTSGGYAIQVALRAVGVTPGDTVLMNAWTLAPVPGAVANVGAAIRLVEINDDWCIDIDDLAAQAAETGARFLLLSHMRGHMADMDAVCTVCEEYGITMIEDCAHTMGAKWAGRAAGNFGRAACFSAQTYKHLNAGEGGLLTTDDPQVAARAVMMSGSYMLYGRHGAVPDDSVFEDVKLDTPNLSGRIDNMRAAIMRVQLRGLDRNIARWNSRYRILEEGFARAPGLRVVERPQHEFYVGSSIQFHADDVGPDKIPGFLERCARRGIELKWFGPKDPVAFTSRYDSWRYLDDRRTLPKTLKAVSTTCDMRVPLTFSEEDCRTIAEIVVEEAGRLAGRTGIGERRDDMLDIVARDAKMNDEP